MLFLYIFFSCLIVTLLFTPYLITIFDKFKIIDLPNKRKIHTESIPRMGGVIIYFMALISIVSFYKELNDIRYIIISSGLILFSGVWDDVLGLKWYYKLFIQICATSIILMSIYSNISQIIFFGIALSPVFGIMALSLLIIGTINAVNMMDGIDGLVTGFSLLTFFIIFVLAYISDNFLLLIISTAIMGSSLGFLKYNANPARIFLGDTGSLSLGYFLILSSILVSQSFNESNNLDITFSIILLGVPIIDTLQVMATRLFNKKSVFLADKNHLHHLILGKNIRHKTAVFLILLLSSGYSITAVYYIKFSHTTGILVFILLSVILIFLDKIITINNQFLKKLDKYEQLLLSHLSKIKNYYLNFALFSLSFLICAYFPGSNIISHNAIILLVIIITLLYASYIYLSYKKLVYTEIFILLNFIFLTVFFNLSTPILKSLVFPNSNIIEILGQTSFFFLIILGVFFLIFKDKVFERKINILSSIDLIILVFIFISIFIQSFIGSKKIELIGTNLVMGFIMFLWYKIIITLRPQFDKILTHFSFFLVELALLFMLLF